MLFRNGYIGLLQFPHIQSMLNITLCMLLDIQNLFRGPYLEAQVVEMMRACNYWHIQIVHPNLEPVTTVCSHRDLKECFDTLSVDPDCRVVMVTGAGKNFTAGKY